MNAAIDSLKQPPAPAPSAALLASRFPGGFVWGTATSAFQIEGAAREGGRGDSIWDVFCRQPGAILDGGTGDVACDHYHRLEDDLDLLVSLGLRAYRFSIAWPRVQPAGSGAWNEEGMAFYDRLINGLLSRGIAPHITLYHWDLPQALQDAGGWAARSTVDRFVDYAREIGRRFGARVASIATHNEPWVIAILGHKPASLRPACAVAVRLTRPPIICCCHMAWRCAPCVGTVWAVHWVLFSTSRRARPPARRLLTWRVLGWKTACWCVGTWTRCSVAPTLKT